MAERSAEAITQLLSDCRLGDREALDELLPLVYSELRRLADSCFRRERPDHTLQPTALVHEAYMRLVGGSGEVTWQNRAHFFGIAARLMRQILVNHAEARGAAKRGGGDVRRGALDDAISFFQKQDIELVRLDDALAALGRLDPRQSEIVELRFFGGLSIDETAEALAISPATVKRDWDMAKTWLFRELSRRD
jgi:RNA polymerase sigma factor (TIGR02999 family)